MNHGLRGTTTRTSQDSGDTDTKVKSQTQHTHESLRESEQGGECAQPQAHETKGISVITLEHPKPHSTTPQHGTQATMNPWPPASSGSATASPPAHSTPPAPHTKDHRDTAHRHRAGRPPSHRSGGIPHHPAKSMELQTRPHTRIPKVHLDGQNQAAGALRD